LNEINLVDLLEIEALMKNLEMEMEMEEEYLKS
jgi:hypothetical protein